MPTVNRKFQMHTVNNQPNTVITRKFLNIVVPSVTLSDCERSWEMDTGEGDAVLLREQSGLAAVVTHRSPRRLETAVEAYNTYFLRELGHKRDSSKDDHEEGLIAYLWADPNSAFGSAQFAVYGACCFLKEANGMYRMLWIWLHPYARRKGHLTRAWAYFQERFGDFIVAGPVSKAMGSFLKTKTDVIDRMARAPGQT